MVSWLAFSINKALHKLGPYTCFFFGLFSACFGIISVYSQHRHHLVCKVSNIMIWPSTRYFPPISGLPQGLRELRTGDFALLTNTGMVCVARLFHVPGQSGVSLHILNFHHLQCWNFFLKRWETHWHMIMYLFQGLVKRSIMNPPLRLLVSVKDKTSLSMITYLWL